MPKNSKSRLTAAAPWPQALKIARRGCERCTPLMRRSGRSYLSRSVVVYRIITHSAIKRPLENPPSRRCWTAAHHGADSFRGAQTSKRMTLSKYSLDKEVPMAIFVLLGGYRWSRGGRFMVDVYLC